MERTRRCLFYVRSEDGVSRPTLPWSVAVPLIASASDIDWCRLVAHHRRARRKTALVIPHQGRLAVVKTGRTQGNPRRRRRPLDGQARYLTYQEDVLRRQPTKRFEGLGRADVYTISCRGQ